MRNNWGAVGVWNYETALIAEKMISGIFLNPGLLAKSAFKIPMAILSSYVGPTHHLIGHLSGKEAIGAFAFREVRKSDRVNFALWEANHETQTQLTCAPTHRGELIEGRRELAQKMEEKQSTLFLSRNLSFTSQALAAAMTETPCMGGRAWNALQCPQNVRAAYCLWFNSLLGLICRWQCGGRQHPGRAQMQLGDIKHFPAPDFAAKTTAAKNAITIANKEYKRLAKLQLMPCSYAWRDDNRKEIDKAVMQMLGITIPEAKLQALREMWCTEPSVHGGNKTILKTLHADKLL